MNKQILFIPGLFALGILVGIAMMNARDDSGDGKAASNLPRNGDTTVDASTPSSNPWSLAEDSDATGDNGHIQQLEDKVADLEMRIMDLEQALASKDSGGASATGQPVIDDARTDRLNRMLTTKSLVKAGLSEDMAAEIVRRRNDIELRKLELRDRAAREGYLGTTRYMRELTEVIEEQTTLREELGDAVYDQYLYANGMPNRVKVMSVMMGSTAEEAGMKDNDIVLSYGQKRMLEWDELKNATSEGELGEYVNVDILRDGQVISLWVPRGPLGVRLSSARLQP